MGRADRERSPFAARASSPVKETGKVSVPLPLGATAARNTAS
ncbi:MAG: hypothetical protein QXO17_00080 [Nitrososphaerota archaeon]|nr:hypothetical protein [Candidatus Calditenuis fumarioli]